MSIVTDGDSAYLEWVEKSGIMSCSESREAWDAATELQEKRIQHLEKRLRNVSRKLDQALNLIGDDVDCDFLK